MSDPVDENTMDQASVDTQLSELSIQDRRSPSEASGGSTSNVIGRTATKITNPNHQLPCISLRTYGKRDNFVGRESEVETIDRYLLPNASHQSDHGLRSFAICGIGGVGKTELAMEYACSRQHSFDAIFWLRADDEKILAADIADITSQLNLNNDNTDVAAGRDAALGWLSKPTKKIGLPDTPENTANWLLIYDNADKLVALDGNWPHSGKGSVLITSKDTSAKHSRYAQNGIDLSPLPDKESQALIQRLAHESVTPSDAEALSLISKKLEGLPLAINHISAFIKKAGISYSEFLEYYDRKGLDNILGEQDVQTSITVWALGRLSGHGKAVVWILSLLDPDDIPEDLLIDGSMNLKSRNRPFYPSGREEYLEARTELLSSSLIKHNQEQGTLSIHRIVQDLTRSSMDVDALIYAFDKAANLVITAWPFQSMKEHHSIARFKNCEQIFPSVLRLKDGLKQFFETSPHFPFNIGVARLFNDVGWYMFERGLPEETKPFCEFSLDIGQRLAGARGSEETTAAMRESHSFLGIALVETNEHDLSMVHKQKWLDMLLTRPSGSGNVLEDYELGYAYNEIGVAYGNENRLDDAVGAFKRSIEIFQGLGDYEDTMLGWPQPNLGFIYWMQGKLEEAEQALVEILDIHAASWGVDDTKSFKSVSMYWNNICSANKLRTGKILYGMGNVLEAQGRYDESLNFHRRCFEQFKQVLGLKHHRVGDIYHKLAGHSIRRGAYQEALDYLDSALSIFTSRPYLVNEQARSFYKKGRLLKALGRQDLATKVLEEAYRLRRKLKPSDLRPSMELRESDFDELVAFWSR